MVSVRQPCAAPPGRLPTLPSTQTTLLPADADAASPSRAHLENVPWLLVAGLLFAWGALWNKLRIDWSINDQYQYGWFVPPLALALLFQRWPERPAPRPTSPRVGGGWLPAMLAAVCLSLLLPLRLIEGPNPDWRLIYWIHAGLLTALSLGLAGWCGGWPWVRHFAFPVGFLLLAVPWPSGLEQDIVQSLMRVVASIAAEIMNLLAIPAEAQGNLIRVRDQMVGVDEACSGIRSLQTMLMGGCLLGELSRLSTPRRLILLGGGLAVAMVANVLRSSLLVWLVARGGIATLEKYHDLAGFSVLLIVFAGLLWITRLLSRGQPRLVPPLPAYDAPRPAEATPRRVSRAFLLAAVCWLAAVEIGNAAWYRSGAPAERPDIPRWTAIPPMEAPGYQNLRIDDRSARLLRYDRGLSVRWTPPDPGHPTGPPDDCTLYFFRWEPGHASGAQANMHQPHICLTASGLTQTADHGVAPLALPGGLTLPVRRYEFLWHGRTIYVFFVVWQDGVGLQTLVNTADDELRGDRLRAVAERRANLGRQTLEFIVGGPADAAGAETVFARAMADAVHRL